MNWYVVDKDYIKYLLQKEHHRSTYLITYHHTFTKLVISGFGSSWSKKFGKNSHS